MDNLLLRSLCQDWQPKLCNFLGKNSGIHVFKTNSEFSFFSQKVDQFTCWIQGYHFKIGVKNFVKTVSVRMGWDGSTLHFCRATLRTNATTAQKYFDDGRLWPCITYLKTSSKLMATDRSTRHPLLLPLLFQIIVMPQKWWFGTNRNNSAKQTNDISLWSTKLQILFALSTMKYVCNGRGQELKKI